MKNVTIQISGLDVDKKPGFLNEFIKENNYKNIVLNRGEYLLASAGMDIIDLSSMFGTDIKRGSKHSDGVVKFHIEDIAEYNNSRVTRRGDVLISDEYVSSCDIDTFISQTKDKDLIIHLLADRCRDTDVIIDTVEKFSDGRDVIAISNDKCFDYEYKLNLDEVIEYMSDKLSKNRNTIVTSANLFLNLTDLDIDVGVNGKLITKDELNTKEPLDINVIVKDLDNITLSYLNEFVNISRLHNVTVYQYNGFEYDKLSLRDFLQNFSDTFDKMVDEIMCSNERRTYGSRSGRRSRSRGEDSLYTRL